MWSIHLGDAWHKPRINKAQSDAGSPVGCWMADAMKFELIGALQERIYVWSQSIRQDFCWIVDGFLSHYLRDARNQNLQFWASALGSALCVCVLQLKDLKRISREILLEILLLQVQNSLEYRKGPFVVIFKTKKVLVLVLVIDVLSLF